MEKFRVIQWWGLTTQYEDLVAEGIAAENTADEKDSSIVVFTVNGFEVCELTDLIIIDNEGNINLGTF